MVCPLSETRKQLLRRSRVRCSLRNHRRSVRHQNRRHAKRGANHTVPLTAQEYFSAFMKHMKTTQNWSQARCGREASIVDDVHSRDLPQSGAVRRRSAQADLVWNGSLMCRRRSCVPVCSGSLQTASCAVHSRVARVLAGHPRLLAKRSFTEAEVQMHKERLQCKLMWRQHILYLVQDAVPAVCTPEGQAAAWCTSHITNA